MAFAYLIYIFNINPIPYLALHTTV